MRARDRDSWRQMLESVFDVEMFLTATAVQVAIGNGDTYGRIPHNFMLYGPVKSSHCCTPHRSIMHLLDTTDGCCYWTRLTPIFA